MTAPKQIVIDWSGVQQYDQRVLLISIPLFSAYGLVLAILCTFGANIITGVIFVGIQIGIGLPASRYAYTLGKSSKSKLTLKDPSQLGTEWKLIRKETHNSDIKRIFENFHKSIKEADKKSVDDLNDLAWFFVTVWAVVSGLVFLSFEFLFPICVTSSGTLAVICFLTYYNGHQGIVNGYFEDDIAHLEYYVQSRLSKIGKLDSNTVQMVIWKVKSKKMVLHDFVVSIYDQNNISLQYYLGIPSQEKERFLISADKAVIENIIFRIDDEKFKEWDVSQNAETEICISSRSSNLSLVKKGSFIQSPDEPIYVVKSASALLQIINACQKR